jgi:hypothetical protein
MFANITRPILDENNVDRVHAKLRAFWQECFELSDWRPSM